MNSGSTNETLVPNTDKWGYVVCFGTVIIFIAGIGQVNSFGLIFRDFIIESHSSAKWIAIAHGIFSIMLAIGGLILNVVSKRYSLRIGGFIGGLIMSLGSFLTLLITNTNQIPFTFGLLQGVGFGMIVPVCYSTLNHYFVKKRTQAMSLVKAIQGLILIWYPQLIKVLLSHYGFRSTLLIISGISLHTLPGLSAMSTNQSQHKRPIKTKKKYKENVGLMCDYQTSKNHDNNVKDDKKVSATFGNVIPELLNNKILRDPIFCNISIGQSFVNCSDLLFFILEPMLLFQYGFDTDEVASCISISAGADVAGRFLLAGISSTFVINTRLLFFVSTFFTLVCRIVILQVRQFFWVALVTSLLGVLRAWLHIASPLVISDHIPHEDFTAAFAVFMLTSGIVNAVTSPIIGLILNVVSKRYSLRIGGFIGGLIMSLGSFLTLLITNTNQIPFTFGLLQGVGFGMIVPVCYSTLNHYFVKKRTQAMSLVKAIQGLILIWYPQLIKVLLSHYGFRSTLLIISGISLHTLPGLSAMSTNQSQHKRPIKTKKKYKENVGLMCDYQTSKNHDNNVKDDKKVSATFGNVIPELLNNKILRDPIFCNISIGQSFVNCSDLLFFILEPMLLFQYGFDTDEVASCISISAGADVAGRFLLAGISSTFVINTRLLFFVSTFFTLVCRIVILQVRQFFWVALVTSLLGVLRAWLHIASPLVISDHIPHEDFTAAFAVFMLTSGIVNAVTSPIIGLTKDLYQDYIPAFYMLSACCVPCLILWPVEYYIRTCRNNNMKQIASSNIL